MNYFFHKVQNKLQEARISDVNHELGKVKENIVTESSVYIANVGSLIRSESTRFSQLLGRLKTKEEGEETQSLPKSTSLPAISAQASTKYKYKSSLCSPPEEEEFDASLFQSRVNESEADKLIKVVKDSEISSQPVVRSSTREDIRRKLAFGNPFNENEKPPNGDLEICFINEAVNEEEEEGEDIKNEEKVEEEEEEEESGLKTEQREDSSEDWEEFDYDSDSVLTRSKSEGDSFKNSDFKCVSERDEIKARLFSKKLSRLQKEVQLNLKECQQIAKSQIAKENQRKREESVLKKLLNIYPEDIGKERLNKLNLTQVQVVLNSFHSEIERLNEELVNLLLQEDELQIEQDSQLLDIEDLCHSLKHEDFHTEV